MATNAPTAAPQIVATKARVPSIPLTIAAVVGVAGIAGYALFARWGGLSFSIAPADAMKVMAPLILTAGFIERAVEVLISPWRDARANKLSKNLELAQAATPPVPDKVSDASDALRQYKGKTQQYAFIASLTLGLAAAFVGLRSLWPLLDASKFGSASSTQRNCFEVVDVVLSAVLLAGGADGIHSVVNAFTGYFDATAKKLQQ